LRVQGKFTSSWTRTFRRARAYNSFSCEEIIEDARLFADEMDDAELFWQVFYHEKGINIDVDIEAGNIF